MTISPQIGAVAVLMMLLVADVSFARGWELVYEADDLRVQRRDYQGSALNEIRGITRLQTSLNALMALLKDAPFNRQWVFRSGGARILEEDGYKQAYVYGIVDAPWPMRDRDTVVRFDYSQHPVSRVITITISNFPDYIATRDGFVRVPDFGGFWQLQPQADGAVEVTYQVYGDPGGWLPVWIANRAAQLSVTRTLQNMKSAVKRYEGTRSPYVDELLPARPRAPDSSGSRLIPAPNTRVALP